MNSRSPARYSIATRLAVAGGFSVAAFVAVMALIVVSFAERASNQAYDRLLLASAQSIADAIRVTGGEIAVDVPIAAFSMLAIGKEDRIFWRVSEEPARVITGYPDLVPDFAFADGADVAFADARHAGRPVRLAATRRLITAAGEPRRVVVLVAETKESRAGLAAEIRNYALLPLLAVCVAAIVMIPFSIRQVLLPVGELAGDLSGRAPGDLHPVGDRLVPREVAPLVGALDHFVDRLRQTLDRNRTFIAEAAHQLRTPLASLRALAELASQERDPAALQDQLDRLRRGAVAASRITNQLLADAAVENRLDAGRREDVRLDRLTAEAVNDAIDFSEGRSIRFDVAEAAEGALVEGDAAALREAVRNLIENAFVHAPSEEPVEVEVVRLAADRVAVAVSDRGPGIPEAARAGLFERFARGPGSSGSGLGLAIVRRVAVAHGGEVELEARAGGGLVARILLPGAAGGEN